MKEEIDEIKIKSGVSRYGHDVKPSGETMQSGSEPAHLTKAEKGQHAVAELSDRDRMYLERFIRDEIQDSIIIWHIGTDVYLRTCEGSKKQDTVVRAIKLLSNYLMFLMVEHPTMVPGIDLRNYYRRTYKTLSDHAGNANGDPDRLAEILAQKGSVNLVFNQNLEERALKSALWLATKLALKLVQLKRELTKEKVDIVKFLFYMWVELLLYVSHRCSRESHAKKLSEGGELTTIVWLMTEQAGKFYIDKKISERDNVDLST